jgi:hypothetical protein
MSIKNPRIGEIIRAKQIGLKQKGYVIWRQCRGCGKCRWVTAREGKPIHIRCKSCSNKEVVIKLNKINTGRHAVIFKGGFVSNRGYKLIYVRPDDFYAPMRNNTGYVAEHRLIVAKSLGRCLKRSEIVHHKNHNKTDNRLENLQLVGNDEHEQITMLETRIKFLESRIIELENKFL